MKFCKDCKHFKQEKHWTLEDQCQCPKAERHCDSEMMDMTCGNCGIQYSMPSVRLDDLKKEHATFYCPNGCPRHFPGKSTEEKLRDEVNELQARIAWYINSSHDSNVRIGELERSNRALRAVITRMKNAREQA